MRELRRTILRMRDVNRRIADTVTRSDQGRSQAVVELRMQFAQECGDFLKHLQLMPMHPGENATFEALQERYEAMQARLRRHQGRWSPREIDANRASYIAAGEVISADIENFVRECLKLIADDWGSGGPDPMPTQPNQAA